MVFSRVCVHIVKLKQALIVGPHTLPRNMPGEGVTSHENITETIRQDVRTAPIFHTRRDGVTFISGPISR